MRYENKFGALTLTPVTPVMAVKDIRGVDIAQEYKFSVDIAEQIALIVESRDIQLCAHKTERGWECYAVIHDSPSVAAVAKIEALEYVGGNPAQEIQKATRSYHSGLV